MWRWARTSSDPYVQRLAAGLPQAYHRGRARTATPSEVVSPDAGHVARHRLPAGPPAAVRAGQPGPRRRPELPDRLRLGRDPAAGRRRQLRRRARCAAADPSPFRPSGRPLPADRLQLAPGPRPAAADLRARRHARLRRGDDGGLAARAGAADRTGSAGPRPRPRARDHRVRGGRDLGRGRRADQAFEVDHRPVVPAFGFRFETAGCRAAFSGDTTGLRQSRARARGRRSAGPRMLHPRGDAGTARRPDRSGPRERRRLSHALLRGRQGREPRRRGDARAQPLRPGRVRPRGAAARGPRRFRRPGRDRRGPAHDRPAQPDAQLSRTSALD